MNTKVLAAAACGIGLLSGCAAPVTGEATDTSAAAILGPGGNFSITHDGVTMCLQSAGFASGAGLEIAPCTYAAYGSQAFTLGSGLIALNGHGLCLTVKNGNYGAGVIDLETCSIGDQYQTWAYNQGFLNPLSQPGLCLGIEGSGQATGTAIVLSQCGAPASWAQGQQTFQPLNYENTTIESAYSYAGERLCLDVRGANLNPGGLLDNWYCQSGNRAQEFILRQGIDGSLIISPGGNTNVCVTASSENASGDGPISLQSCSGSYSQDWAYQETNGLWGGSYNAAQLLALQPGPSPYSYECIDVQYGSNAPSTPLDMAPCNVLSGFNFAQAWYIKAPGLY